MSPKQYSGVHLAEWGPNWKSAEGENKKKFQSAILEKEKRRIKGTQRRASIRRNYRETAQIDYRAQRNKGKQRAGRGKSQNRARRDDGE